MRFTAPIPKSIMRRSYGARNSGSRRGRISFQVLQEFYVNVDRKWPDARDQVQAEIRNPLTWGPIAMNSEILESGWKIQERYRLSFWDSLSVAAAKAALRRYLLTEDLQDDQEWDGVKVVNPFRGELTGILPK